MVRCSALCWVQCCQWQVHLRECLLDWACKTYSFPTNVCIINGSQMGFRMKFYAQWRFSIILSEQSRSLGECVGGAN